MSRKRMPRAARDKWSRKRWFSAYSSSAFGYAELATVTAEEPKQLLGRTLVSSFYDITQDISQLPIKLKFQIVRVDDQKAYTQFAGFHLSRDYVRSLVRRGSTRIDSIANVTTSDGVALRVTAMTLTQHRVKTSQERAIRRLASDVVKKMAEALNFDEFIQESVLGRVSLEVHEKAKKIYPLRKVETLKVKVLTSPFSIPLKIPGE